jgi:hypothetical protein
MREPRDPLLKVVLFAYYADIHSITFRVCEKNTRAPSLTKYQTPQHEGVVLRAEYAQVFGFATQTCTCVTTSTERADFEFVNDPSAGSPTETLLRLLLPLNDQV